jgi:hypothetical protein
MSDMSGQSMRNGFEEYITGYPLKKMNLYAFAKTWYAPEMKRPGCVWTHTLLIKFPDLVYLNSSKGLLNLFEKPVLDSDFNSYSVKKEVFIEDSDFDIKQNFFNEELLEETIFNLYSKQDGSVLLQVKNPCEAESIILSIWTQQWPRLKRNFSFCTGSISPRSVNGRYLDLQAIPYDGNLLKSNDNFLILGKSSPKTKKENWVMVIYNDLLIPSNLRDFLKRYGVDVKNERGSFKSLVELFSFLKDNSDQKTLSQIIKVVAGLFPSSNDANILKSSLFGLNSLNNVLLSFNEEEEILFQLSITRYYKSFDISKLLLRERIKSLYLENSDLVLRILNDMVGLEINPFGIEMLKEIAFLVDENSLESINKKYRKLLSVFLSLNINILYFDSFWKCKPEDQKENFHILLKINEKNRIDFQKFVNKILELGVYIDHDLISNNSFDIIHHILTWLNDDPSRCIPSDLRGSLANYSKEILSWFNEQKRVNSNAVDFLLSTLNPNSKDVINNGDTLWIKLLKNNEIKKNCRLELNLKAFVLALILNKPNQNSLDLFSITFESVYISILKDNLDFDSWKRIEIHTKQLVWWNDWDKGKKLLTALFEIFSKNGWEANDLEKLFKNREVFERVLTLFKKY